MAMISIDDWLDTVNQPNFIWYIKRLSSNDAQINSHQAGPYIPKVIFKILPSINQPTIKNPKIKLDLDLDSHADSKTVTITWYNNKISGIGTRNELRITNLGGDKSALLDPENIGALTVFAFDVRNGIANRIHAWVCEYEKEALAIEKIIGQVEPGRTYIYHPENKTLESANKKPKKTSCYLTPAQILANWNGKFPTTLELVKKSIEVCSANSLNIDQLLLKRRDCEYEIFQSIEAYNFNISPVNATDIQEFLITAQTILQRRKSRSGFSLELHIKELFIEEGLIEDINFSYQKVSENRKKPDFIFPSHLAYKDPSFPAKNLRMLAVKTTCKDRWRQVLEEADRIKQKHLLTLQEGISENQFYEMVNANIQLVVPQPFISKYPKSIQHHLQTLESFIADIRLLSI